MVSLELEGRLAEDRRFHPVVVGSRRHGRVVVDEDAVLPDGDLIVDQLDAHGVPAVSPVVGKASRWVVGVERSITMFALLLAATLRSVNLDFPLVAQVEAAVAAVNFWIAAVLVESEEVTVRALGPDVVATTAGSGVGEGVVLYGPEHALLGAPAVLRGELAQVLAVPERGPSSRGTKWADANVLVPDLAVVALQHQGALFRRELPLGSGIDAHRAAGELVLVDIVLDQHSIVPDGDPVPDVDDAVAVPLAGFFLRVFEGDIPDSVDRAGIGLGEVLVGLAVAVEDLHLAGAPQVDAAVTLFGDLVVNLEFVISEFFHRTDVVDAATDIGERSIFGGPEVFATGLAGLGGLPARRTFSIEENFPLSEACIEVPGFFLGRQVCTAKTRNTEQKDQEPCHGMSSSYQAGSLKRGRPFGLPREQ